MNPQPRLMLFSGALALLASCADFRHLAKDLKMLDEPYRIYGHVTNADEQDAPVYAGVIEWDEASGKVFSGDRVKLTKGGAFIFTLASPLNQHVAAFADMNGNGRHEDGEPFWMHTDAAARPAPVSLDGERPIARVKGRLSRSLRPPLALREAIEKQWAGRTADEVIRRHGADFALGEMADLDEPRFAATRGKEGLWTPASFAIAGGFGIYFLEPYDPKKIPVLLIHGFKGSPQDWRPFISRLDRKVYQPWFYFYPTGLRLARAGDVLNDGVKMLHDRYRFDSLVVVAHSMGGLVARDFVVRNAVIDRQHYIRTFITFSTPWQGHDAAALGLRYSPEKIPSWIDMAPRSDFLAKLYDRRLKGRVDHHLFFSYRARRSAVLPPENDGAVSVASQRRPQALADARSVQGYDEDHDSILRASAVLTKAKSYMDGGR